LLQYVHLRNGLVMINTQISIEMLVTIFLFFLGCIRWMDLRFNKIEKAIDIALKDRWTRTDHRIWTLELKLGNPSLTVSVPDDLHKEENEGFAYRG